MTSSTARRQRLAGLLVVLGGLAIIVVNLGFGRRSLSEAVVAIGASLVAAGLLPGARDRHFLASGLVLLGLGVGATLSNQPSLHRYELALDLGGIGVGLAILRAMREGPFWGAATGVLGAAAAEAGLTGATGGPVARAFDQGWAFGLVQTVYGLVLVALVTRGRRRRTH